MLKRIVLWIGIGLLLAVAVTAWLYVRDMRRSYDRIRDGSSVIPSAYGDIEFAEGGSGQPVLIVHGGGGGFDQGALIADLVLGPGFHWMAPSRFGYLRSDLPDGATWDDQAHAFAQLLDHLNVDSAAVVALSQGGASALLFAALYPDRVSSVTCLSCGVAPAEPNDRDQSAANRKGDLLKAVFARDLPYWAVTTLLRGSFIQLMGADRTVVDQLGAEGQRQIDRLIDTMNPASPRARGAAFDNVALLPGERIRDVQAPTLVIHARDDRLQLFRNAEFAYEAISTSRILSFDRGGHVVLAVELDSIRAAVQDHIRSPRGRSHGS